MEQLGICCMLVEQKGMCELLEQMGVDEMLGQ